MTPDPLDAASEMEEAQREKTIAAIRKVKKQHHHRCLYCNAETTDGAAFCDDYCQEDHEMAERMKMIKGLR